MLFKRMESCNGEQAGAGAGAAAGTTNTTTVTLANVLFGAVFLCSGQSNMDFSVAPWGGT